MRRWLGQQMARPWVAAIGCTAIFLAGMALVRFALEPIRRSNDTVFSLEVGVPALAAIFFVGWLMQRAGIGRE